TSRIGYEYAHLVSAEQRRWLRDAIEGEQFPPRLDGDDAISVLDELTKVEAFERFLHKAFVGQKRFSIEGVDMILPMLDEVLTLAMDEGYAHIVLGMAHRGRLAVRTFLTGQSFGSIFRAFSQAMQTGQDTGPDPGDVKYHLGATGHSGQSPDGPLVHLRPNPSHLEFVNPVVEGYTRALQDDRSSPGAPSQDYRKALPVLIHGDAAFPGEGVVAETLNLSALEGYRTGGTIHIIANNQIGFTTNPSEGCSTRYASDLAKGFEIPVFHVNADDPEACIAATRLAFAFRERFGRDVLIDVVGYRRWGHNESDEPAYTQPLRYQKIERHPTVRAIWAKTLEQRGVIPPGDAEARLAAIDATLREAAEGAGVHVDVPTYVRPVREDVVDTKVPLETLQALNAELLKLPEGFTPMPRLYDQLTRSRGVVSPDRRLDWGHAEALA
ncbi:MAG: thiamine pyrophosphate-dependent enzyme, partial [Dehalococcoidia bacterium]|nr:thiamine pyrophosphate-dependent enzyme [Dehalococcoidia bacterium]